jgi:hypothetical protein
MEEVLSKIKIKILKSYNKDETKQFYIITCKYDCIAHNILYNTIINYLIYEYNNCLISVFHKLFPIRKISCEDIVT